MPNRKLYKFLHTGLKSAHGDKTWEMGKWEHEESPTLCSRGFHASKEIGQAFSYVQGEVLAEVEVKGTSDKEKDKECWSDMRIVKAYKWQKKDSVALSVYSAELCLANYEKVYPNDKRPREAIEAAKKWILNPTEENQSAARSAGSAARSAAWSAAGSAAGSAGSAARSAESAARSAARSAESAAGSAAGSAGSAARSAESAAGSAAGSAREKVTKQLYKWFQDHLIELEPYD